MANIDMDIPSMKNDYDFKDEDVSVFKTPKGLNEDIVREISAIKKEPEWMLEYRLKSLKCFLEKPMPTWGVDLSQMNIHITIVQVIIYLINGMKFLKQLKTPSTS